MSILMELPKLDRPPSYASTDPRGDIQVASPSEQNPLSTPLSQSRCELELHRPDRSGLLIESGGHTLYCVGHYHTKRHPGVILYGGYDNHGPRLAQVDFMSYGKDFRIFVGDQKTPTEDDWDIVRASGGGLFKDPQHRFEVRYNSADGQRVKRKLHWQKTSDSKLGASLLSPRDYKLIAENDDSVAAVYIERYLGAREHVGTIRFQDSAADLPEKAQIAIMMVLLGLLDKLARESKNRVMTSGR